MRLIIHLGETDAILADSGALDRILGAAKFAVLTEPRKRGEWIGFGREGRFYTISWNADSITVRPSE